MDYIGQIIRPPSEANSILLQVTTGCSHNRCTFCGAYRQKRFSIKATDQIQADIAEAARTFPDHNHLFLCDGDAVIIPQTRLLTILTHIQQQLPQVKRVASYGNAKSIALKSDAELQQLQKKGLRLIHLGLESGDDQTLAAINKYGDANFIIEQGQRVRAAGMKLFVTVLLGIAGADNSQRHAKATGQALSQMAPEYVGALSLMPTPETPLYNAIKSGDFTVLPPMALLEELRTLIQHTTLKKGLFFANHASNYLAIRARLPNQKNATLQRIDQALEGAIALKPEWLRAL